MRRNAQYTIFGKPASEPKRQPMKKRLQIGKFLKGDKRLEGETFVEYKERLKLETSLLRDYGKGIYISSEQHHQDAIKKRLDN